MKKKATLRYILTLPVRIFLAIIYLIAYTFGYIAKNTEKIIEIAGKKIQRWTRE